MTVYLKTLLTFEYELKYLLLNLDESMPYVDKVILCEANRTHTGEERSYIYDKLKSKIPDKFRSKIIYVKGDLSKDTTLSKSNGRIIHKNEKIIRGFFTRHIKLYKNDIIFSVDTDEILYRKTYPILIQLLQNPGILGKAYKLNLVQFFYKINYLWMDKDFIGPTACTGNFYKLHPAQWRYHGKLYPEKAGCHFSWCMSVRDMIKKLAVYSHHQDYGHLAKKDILEEAIEKKTYPFNIHNDFRIATLNLNECKNIYPETLFDNLSLFEEVIYGKF